MDCLIDDKWVNNAVHVGKMHFMQNRLSGKVKNVIMLSSALQG